MSNFEESLKLVLVHEGGYVDHPRDPGGATNLGVTIAVFRSFFGKDKTKDDLQNIMSGELERVYREGYWDKCRCDELPAGVDYVVFDAAVNSGVSRSSKWLQGIVGATQDGVIGPNTIKKVIEYRKRISLIDKLCDIRLLFLKDLSNWRTFGKGWSNRVKGVRSDAIIMS